MPLSTISPGEFQLGENLHEQLITVTGAPSSASLTFGYLDRRTVNAATLSSTASDVQTLLRTLPYCDSVTVSGNTGGPWTVQAGPNASLVEPIRVYAAFTGGSSPGVTVSIVDRKALLHSLVSGDGIGEATVPPTVARQTTPSDNAVRADQTKASEWITLRNLTGGFNRFHYDEIQTVNQFWGSECWTHVKDQITLPALVEEYTIDGDIGTVEALVCCEIGVTANGARIIQTLDPDGTSTDAVFAWLDTTNETLTPLMYSAAVVDADTPRADIIFYQGYAYIGREKSGSNGYVTWNGDSSTDVVPITTTDASPVVAWCEFNGNLYRLLKNGKIQYTTTAAATESDWSATIATYRGIGYAYAMKVFRDSAGLETIFVIATDGLYSLNMETYGLKRIQEINGSIIPQNGQYPQASGVQIYGGNLVWVHADENVLRFDGSSIVNLGPSKDDGLPERSHTLDRAIRVRSLLPLNNYLLAFCSATTQTGSAGSISGNTTLSVETTYINSLTVSSTAILTVNADLYVLDGADNVGTVLLYNNEGWHTLIPLDQPAFSDGRGTRGGVYHELSAQPRLEFAPGKFIRFRDKPARPQDWADQKWDTSTARSIVSGYFDANAADIPKTAFSTRFGYHDAGSGCTITPYFQIDDCPDDPSGATSSNPAAGWTMYVDGSGNNLVIGDGTDPTFGVVKGFFDYDSGTGGHRGLVFQQLRKRVDLASSDSARTPVLEFASTPYTARYDTLFWWQNVRAVLKDGKDGRTARVVLNDLRQLTRSKTLHPFKFSNEYFYVLLDAISVGDMTTGAVATAENNPVAVMNISEWTRL